MSANPASLDAAAQGRLRHALRHCPPAACEMAVEFRKTGRPELIPAVVRGLVERYVEPDLRGRLAGATGDLRLAEHLGIDSLSLIELGMLAEDALAITIDNRELREIHTLQDLERFVAEKLN